MSPGRLAVLAFTCGVLLGGASWAALQRAGTPAGPSRDREPVPCDPPDAGHAQPVPPAPVPPTGAQPGAPASEAARYTVCEREEAPARLSELSLPGDRKLWALHCGSTLHLIAIEALGPSLFPQRAARVQAVSPSPAETPVAVAARAADLDGDGRSDWIAPVLLVDAAGVPRGGGVYLLAFRAHGGFDPPRKLLTAAPGAIAIGALDGEPAHDLALLHRKNAGTGEADELWLVSGGAAGGRFAQRPALVSATGLAALDLDLDGKDDVAVASAREGRLRLWLSGRGALAHVEPAELDLAGAHRLLAADLDGDGARELLVEADGLHLLRARTGGPGEPEPLADSQGLRDVHVADADADGAPDLVGYAHPEVIALSGVLGPRPSRKAIAALRGEPSVLFARAAQLDADPRPELVLVLVSPDGASLELAVARNLGPQATVHLATDSAPLADTALLETFSAR